MCCWRLVRSTMGSRSSRWVCWRIWPGDAVDDVCAYQVTDAEIVDLLQLVLASPFANSLTRQFTLTAFAKLYVRFAEANSSNASTQQERITEVLASYGTSPDLELQQRAIEFTSLFGRNDLVGGVLEHMPAPEIRATIMGTGGLRGFGMLMEVF